MYIINNKTVTCIIFKNIFLVDILVLEVILYEFFGKVKIAKKE